jgi:hypothetical protein
MTVIDYSLRRRVAALEAGSPATGTTTQAGAPRPLAGMFTLPDAAKDYYVTYRWDSTATGHLTIALLYGDADAGGFVGDPVVLDSYDRVQEHHAIELRGRVPAGKSVFIQVNQGSDDPVTSAIETPLS